MKITNIHRGIMRIVQFSIVLAAFVLAQAQDQVYPAKKPTPTKMYPELFVVANQVVEEQWPATLGLVNGPSDLKVLEPGQCIRFGILASGDDRDRLLTSSKLGFEFSFGGPTKSFPAETPEAVKQAKPEGETSSPKRLGWRASRTLFQAWQALRYHERNGVFRLMPRMERQRFKLLRQCRTVRVSL